MKPFHVKVNQISVQVQRQRLGDTMQKSSDQKKMLNNMYNVDSRVQLINELLSKGLKQTELETINGVLKAASIGIIPKDDNKMNNIKDLIIKKFTEESPEDRRKMYWVFNSILGELPTHKKILNRGPIRHGILGFKDHVVHGNDWNRLGPAGDFPKTLHQLSHQIPAPELGHICKAYAQYLRTDGNMQEFDRVLAQSGINFEEYFVNNAKRIAGGGQSWCQISTDKPKGVLNVSDEDMRNALEHRGWSGKNVDELMSRLGPKTATFFDVYGDTIIETLEGQGIRLSTSIKELEKFLKPQTVKSIHEFEDIKIKTFDKNCDENWKRDVGYPNILKLATGIRKDIQNDILSTKDINKLQGLLSLDKSLESTIDTVSIHVLSKAPKEKGLMYKLDSKTENLMLNLMENYTLSNSKNSTEIHMLTRDFQDAFASSRRNSQSWAQSTMVPLNRLDRLVQRISKDTSDSYRPIAAYLSNINPQTHKEERVEQLADGILRGQLLFPISQIYSGFKSELRKMGHSSPWQVLSSGDAAGKVIHAKSMENLEEIIDVYKLGTEKLICLVDSLAGAEEPPHGVHAIITPRVIDTLSHIGVRSRQEKIVFVCLDDTKIYEDIKKNFSSGTSYMNLMVKDETNTVLKPLSKSEYDALDANTWGKDIDTKPIKVVIPVADLSSKEAILDISEIKFATSGPKATNIAKLANIVPIPQSLDIPFAVFDNVLKAPQNKGIFDEYSRIENVINQKQKAGDISVDKELLRLKELVMSLRIPDNTAREITDKVHKTMPSDTQFVMTRSSTNGEDLANFSGAGLYSSQPNLVSNVLDGMKIVWASKWNKRAYDARVKASIPHEALHVSVLVQPCIDTKYGFVTHTSNPINRNPNEVFIEIVQGQNEALVSGKIPGTGYGFLYNKQNGDVTRTHLADKSYQFLPSESGGTKITLADYKNDKFAGDKSSWEETIKQIGEYSVNIEKLYKGVPQDIEGCIKNGSGEMFIVQTRDQLGL